MASDYESVTTVIAKIERLDLSWQLERGKVLYGKKNTPDGQLVVRIKDDTMCYSGHSTKWEYKYSVEAYLESSDREHTSLFRYSYDGGRFGLDSDYTELKAYHKRIVKELEQRWEEERNVKEAERKKLEEKYFK